MPDYAEEAFFSVKNCVSARIYKGRSAVFIFINSQLSKFTIFGLILYTRAQEVRVSFFAAMTASARPDRAHER